MYLRELVGIKCRYFVHIDDRIGFLTWEKLDMIMITFFQEIVNSQDDEKTKNTEVGTR